METIKKNHYFYVFLVFFQVLSLLSLQYLAFASASVEGDTRQSAKQLSNGFACKTMQVLLQSNLVIFLKFYQHSDYLFETELMWLWLMKIPTQYCETMRHHIVEKMCKLQTAEYWVRNLIMCVFAARQIRLIIRRKAPLKHYFSWNYIKFIWVRKTMSQWAIELLKTKVKAFLVWKVANSRFLSQLPSHLWQLCRVILGLLLLKLRWSWTRYLRWRSTGRASSSTSWSRSGSLMAMRGRASLLWEERQRLSFIRT